MCAGNYGNKLDENSPAQSSTTPPSNPIFDGNSYYYLPWLDQKPCIQVGTGVGPIATPTHQAHPEVTVRPLVTMKVSIKGVIFIVLYTIQ